ncbi:hypothetical protein IWX50DRAFT_617833 [Phyllosticta citricarpa]|uniref:Uncharacterized protein n=1 Tax=Phyllosticta citricarpa TaxID=55181 RepID=A0ABR1MFH9_9PEZI
MTRVAFLSLLTYLNQPNLAILDLARQPTAHPVNKPPLSVAPNVLLSATDSRPYRCAFFSAKSAPIEMTMRTISPSTTRCALRPTYTTTIIRRTSSSSSMNQVDAPTELPTRAIQPNLAQPSSSSSSSPPRSCMQLQAAADVNGGIPPFAKDGLSCHPPLRSPHMPLTCIIVCCVAVAARLDIDACVRDACTPPSTSSCAQQGLDVVD